MKTMTFAFGAEKLKTENVNVSPLKYDVEHNKLSFYSNFLNILYSVYTLYTVLTSEVLSVLSVYIQYHLKIVEF